MESNDNYTEAFRITEIKESNRMDKINNNQADIKLSKIAKKSTWFPTNYVYQEPSL